MPTRRRTGRRPGPSQARRVILDAARHAFAERGYERATIRYIAGIAGFDSSLVMQLFGSKDGLFAAAIQLPFDPADLVAHVLDDDSGTLGERLVRRVLEFQDDPESGPRLRALIRCASTHERAADRVRELMYDQLLHRVIAGLGLHGAGLRAGLVAAQLLGLEFARYVLRIEPLASATHDELVRLIGPTVDRYLMPDGM